MWRDSNYKKKIEEASQVIDVISFSHRLFIQSAEF